jgi:molybdopterin synthase sulfur carrier subunit
MKVRIKAFARFREIIGSENTLELDEGASVLNALKCLSAGSKDFRDACFDKEGTIASHVVLMINSKRISGRDRDATVLHDGDELAVFPPVAGG